MLTPVNILTALALLATTSAAQTQLVSYNPPPTDFNEAVGLPPATIAPGIASASNFRCVAVDARVARAIE